MSELRDILYVDDERSNLIVFDATFEDDFRVHTASSAAEALEIIEEVPIPVVIADQRMPDMTGVELFSLIRRKHPHIQRVILSGYAESDSIISAINDGQVFQFVRKPWQRPELLAVIRRAMEAHDMSLENTSLMERLLVSEQCALLGRATADIAHEMGSQLNVLPLIEMVEDDFAEHPDLLKMAEIARGSYERLRTLVDEIKSIVRQERTEVNLHLVSLADVIRELLSFLRFNRSFPSSKIVADLRCEPTILGNKLKLHQVLMNLVNNAKDAIEGLPNGRIAIHLRCQGGMVDLSVADNGTGIPHAIHEKIWEPFFTTKGKQGTGLGLDLVKRLVSAQHGKIQMISEPGQGTQFTLSFPVIASPMDSQVEFELRV
jgi:signal transduction histidine kinase